MDPSAHVLITSSTVGLAGANTFVIQQITQDYRDLILVLEAQSSFGGGFGYIQFNGDGNQNYTYSRGLTDGNGTFSANGYTTAANQFGYVRDNAKGLYICEILDYSVTDKHKIMLVDSNEQDAGMFANRWIQQPQAINRIDVKLANGFTADTKYSLYGVKG